MFQHVSTNDQVSYPRKSAAADAMISCLPDSHRPGSAGWQRLAQATMHPTKRGLVVVKGGQNDGKNGG